MRLFVAATALTVGIPAAGLVLFGFFSAYLPIADSAAHFRLHAGVVLVGLSFVLAACRWWRSAGAIAVAGLAGILSTAAITGVLTPATALPNGKTLRVYSFNLKYGNLQHDAIFDQIEVADPDVVFFQEMNTANWPLLNKLAGNYELLTACNRDYGDVAILVRSDIKAIGPTACHGIHGLASAEIAFADRKVALATIHLHWPAPYGQPDDLAALASAFEALAQPAIIAGDFNAAPWSQTVAQVEERSGTKLAPGIRPSFLPWPLAEWLTPYVGLPIDHVLLPDGAAVERITVLPPAGSDHRPLLADIVLP